MSTSDTKSPITRFLEAFLQEKNIRWVLLTGMGILLASAVVLVGTEWNDFSDTIRYGIILLFGGATYAAARIASDRLLLHRTGLTLFGVMTVLIPLSFLVPGWLFDWGGGFSALLGNLGMTGLVGLHVAGAIVVSYDTAKRLLVKPPISFLVAYILLSVAGLLVPMFASDSLARYHALACGILWSVMAMGTIKVNRHVFWLLEEYQAPKVFGFLPIALLMGQFVTITTLIQPQLAWPHVGVLVSLSALPVLLSADALYRVFEHRTGGHVSHVPALVLAPLFVGLAASFAGVGLAMLGFTTQVGVGPLCLTGLLTSIYVGGVGYRLKKSPMVMIATVGLLAVYTLLPFLLPELWHQVTALGGWVVGETTAPIALLPIAYLPAIVGLLLLSRGARRRGFEDHFVKPIEVVATTTAQALIPMGLLHRMTWLLVGAPMLVMFLMQAKASRSARYVYASVASLFLTGMGLIQWVVPGYTEFDPLLTATGLIFSTGVLFVARPRLARLADQVDATFAWLTSIAQAATLTLTSAAIIWFAIHPLNVLSTALVAGIIGLQVLSLATAPGRLWAGVLLTSLQLAVVKILFDWTITHPMALFSTVSLFMLALTIMAAATWVIFVSLRSATRPALSALSETARDMAKLQTLLLILAYGITMIPSAVFAEGVFTRTCTGTAILVALSAHMAIVLRDRTFGYAGSIVALLLTTCLGLQFIGPSDRVLPLVASTAGAMALAGCFVERRLCSDDLAKPLTRVGCAVLAGFAGLGLTMTSPSIVATGLIVLASVGSASLLIRNPVARTLLLGVLNLQVLSIPLHLAFLGQAGLHTLTSMSLGQLLALAPWLACLAAIGAAIWNRVSDEFERVSKELALSYAFVMILTCAAAIVGCVVMPSSEWNVLDTVLLGITTGAVALHELQQAKRLQSKNAVVSAYVAIAGYVCLLFHHGVVHIGTGFGPLVLVLSSVVLRGLAHVLKRSKDYQIAEPLTRVISLTLPTLASAAVVLRHLVQPNFEFTAEIPAVYLASGFYVWQAIENRHRWFSTMAAILANVAIFLTWTSVGFGHQQLIMIPLGATILLLVRVLSREIPARLHDPLRYIGALMMLVSPIGNILNGSWFGYVLLMLIAVGVLLAAIGFQVRAMLYTSTMFLAGDLIAIVVKGCYDNPNILWAVGLALGASVIALGAYCERRRETILARIDVLSSSLAQWK